MEVGDFVISNYGPLEAHPCVVKIRTLDPVTAIPINGSNNYSSVTTGGWNKSELYTWRNYKGFIESPTLKEFAINIQRNPYFNSKYKEEFIAFLIKKFREEFNIPEKIPVRPEVIYGETSGFIKITRRENIELT